MNSTDVDASSCTSVNQAHVWCWQRTALASRHADPLVPDDTHHSVDICVAEAPGTGLVSHCDAQGWYGPSSVDKASASHDPHSSDRGP